MSIVPLGQERIHMPLITTDEVFDKISERMSSLQQKARSLRIDPWALLNALRVLEEKPSIISKNHPELEDGEVFVENSNDIWDDDRGNDYDNIKLATKRRGQCAYDADGRRLEKHFPVFAKREELERTGREFSEPQYRWPK